MPVTTLCSSFMHPFHDSTRKGVRSEWLLRATRFWISTLLVLTPTAWADMRATSLDGARQIRVLFETLPVRAEHELTINGARVRVSTGTLEMPLARAIEELHRDCRHSQSVLQPLLTAKSSRDALVACARPRGTIEEAGTWLGQFTTSGDLTDLVHFGFAHAVAQGERTSVLTVQPLDGLVAEQMFAPSGDAPGQELPGVTRPEKSRRVLSVALGSRPQLVSYQSKQSPKELLHHYGRSLRAQGFRMIRAPNAPQPTGQLPTAPASLLRLKPSLPEKQAGRAALVTGPATAGSATYLLVAARDGSGSLLTMARLPD